MTHKPTLVIDLDNTLCECGQYYIDAKFNAAQIIEDTTGMIAAKAAELIEAIDRAAISGPQGFSRTRFPTSFAIAAEAASRIMTGRDNLRLATTCHKIADSVFTADYALYPKVKETLKTLRSDGWQLVISSKGDEEVQNYKIQKHSLHDYVDHVFISLTKTSDELHSILVEVNADPKKSWVVGDSLKDDIERACIVGVKSILVDPGSNTEWQKNFHSRHEPTAHVPAFKDILAVVTEDIALSWTKGY